VPPNPGLSDVSTCGIDALFHRAGNLHTRTDFNGKTTTFGYDALNRLLSKTPDASFNAAPISFAYTATGRRETMTDPSGVTSYEYNERDLLKKKITPFGTLEYTYDAAGISRPLPARTPTARP
jgi:YD repeat-containing protein